MKVRHKVCSLARRLIILHAVMGVVPLVCCEDAGTSGIDQVVAYRRVRAEILGTKPLAEMASRAGYSEAIRILIAPPWQPERCVILYHRLNRAHVIVTEAESNIWAKFRASPLMAASDVKGLTSEVHLDDEQALHGIRKLTEAVSEFSEKISQDVMDATLYTIEALDSNGSFWKVELPGSASKGSRAQYITRLAHLLCAFAKASSGQRLDQVDRFFEVVELGELYSKERIRQVIQKVARQ